MLSILSRFTWSWIIFISVPTNAQEYEVVKIDPSKKVALSDVFESVKVIGLEQTEEALFGFRFSIIRTSGEMLYISTFSNDRKKIFGYDLEGNLVHVIKKFGPGPDELGQLINFSVVDDHTLTVLSQTKNTLYTFDINEDKIIRKQRFTGNPTDHYVIDPEADGYYFLKGPTALHNYFPPYSWLTRVDSQLNEVAGFLPGKHSKNRVNYMPYTTHNLQVFNKKVLALRSYSDTIQAVRNGTISPEYVLDFGNYKRYDEYSLNPKTIDEAFRKRNQVSAIDFIDTHDRLVLSYLYETARMTIYDKASGISRTTAISRSFNRTKGFYLRLVHADDERVIFTYSTRDWRIDNFLKTEMGKEGVENWSQLDFDVMEEEEIPLLLSFKFRQ